MKTPTFRALLQVQKRFRFSFWMIVLSVTQLAAADPNALKIEEAQRAFQERHEMIFGESVSWPNNAWGQSAPSYPPDGFYEADLSNATTAAALVADFASKFEDSRLLWHFTTAEGGEIEDMDGYYDTLPPLLGDRLTMPRSTDVTPGIYPVLFRRLVEGLCAAKYAIVIADQVGSAGKGTLVALRTGGSYDETTGGMFESSNWPEMKAPDEIQNSGSFTLEFNQTLIPGHYRVAASATYDEPTAWSTGNWTVGGMAASVVSDPIEWIHWYYCPGQDPPWCTWIFWEISPCNVPNEIPSGTALTDYIVNDKTITVPWQLDVTTCGTNQYWSYLVQLAGIQEFSCEEHFQRAKDFWNTADWEEKEGVFIGASVVADYGHWLKSWRGRIYANLSNFTGTARCYLSAEGGEYLIDFAGSRERANAFDPTVIPVAPDLRWHFFQPVPTRTEWSSDVIGDAMPDAENCEEQWDWSVVQQIVIVIPDFQNNIESCSSCTTCGGTDCTPGAFSGSLVRGALDFSISLGLDSYGKSAGELNLRTLSALSNLHHPSALAFHTSPDSEVIQGADGTIRQIKNSQVLADIVVTSGDQYDVRFYTAVNAGTKDGNGFYEPIGTPYKILSLNNPDGGGTSQRLRVTESGDGINRASEFACSVTDQSWSLETGNGIRKETTSSQRWTDGSRTETYRVMDNVAGTVLYEEQRVYHTFPWAEEMVRRTVDPAGAALTTAWFYYEDQQDGDNYSRLKLKIDPSGYWERYQYDPMGRTIEISSQYLDASVDAPNSACRVTTTVYATNDPAVTVVETVQDVEASRRYTVYRPGETRDLQALHANASWDAPGNLATITRTYVTGPFEGRTQSVSYPDGTMSLYEYDYSVTDGRSNLVTTISTGQPNAGLTAIANGTKIIRKSNLAGVTVREEEYDITDGMETLLTWSEAVSCDDFGRATQINYSDGTSAAFSFGCCGLDSTTDREGILSMYTYDPLNRVATTTRAGITVSNSYDAAGNIVGTVRIGSDYTPIIQTISTYDMARRRTSSTDALTNTTAYFEFVDANTGHLVKSNVYADGSCLVETSFQDGQLESRTGTAVHGVRYEYGVDGDGQYTKEIRLATDGSDTAEWAKTYFDMAGRAYKTVYADDSFNQSVYNDLGQLAAEIDPDGVTTLYAYNNRGELATQAIDMDQNGTIDFDGMDRITKIEKSTAAAHGTTVRRATTLVWETDNADASAVVNVMDTASDGRQMWNVSFGLTNYVRIDYAGHGQRTTISTNPDGSYVSEVYQDDRITSRTQNDSNGVQILGTTYAYDPHGRLVTETDSRMGTTTYGYNDADELTWVTTPAPAPGQLPQTTEYRYDARGRQTTITLPDAGTVSAEFFDTGEIREVFGVRIYPVQYSYDYAGRLKSMTTWRDFGSNTGTATTTWSRDDLRGFLTGKKYDDDSIIGYRYSAGGRLIGRSWARGVITSYTYNNAGELEIVTYSDPTPPVTVIYDRQGRRFSASCGTNTSTFTYNEAGQLLTESFPTSGGTITNRYDLLLRRQELSTGALSSPVRYTYDAASRLSSVADDSHSVSYAYLPSSSLVSGITFTASGMTRMAVSKTYDNLDRLTWIRLTDSASALLNSFSYSYNPANQRVRMDLKDGSFWSYEYDQLGQVISGKRFWNDEIPVEGQQYGYAFDTIGNRTSTTLNGRVATYSVSSLNQYRERTVPGFLDVIGTAASNATVTVNLQPAQRRGDYFHAALEVPNTASAAYTNISIVGVRKNAGDNGKDVVTETIGREFLSESPESFSYDPDGNLTSDGRWNYSWDAENRLIVMETTDEAVNAGAPKQKFCFGYDCQNRRVSKIVSNYDGNTWIEMSNLKFVYDGWNLVAELDKTNAPLRSFVWGLDLSGSEQAAGGVGGLLFVTSRENPSGTQFVSCDGNGNIVALLDAQTGVVSAQYEHGPFGEPIRTTGPAAKMNPFRFSTKYADDSGLLYYGYRYYNPTIGRWLTRDLMQESGGFHLYGYMANDVPNYIDPIGLNLYAVDGTGNDEDAKSNVSRFFTRYRSVNGSRRYYRGVGAPEDNGWGGQIAGGAFGAGSAGLVKAVMCQICRDYRENSGLSIDVVGFSRGAAIANEIATELRRDGCPNPDGAWTDYPTVRFLGLFDAVYSFPRYVSWAWNDTTIPENVWNAAHALAQDETRSLFRPSILQPASSRTQFSEQWFPGRHSDIGGTIDMNGVIGIWTLRWMIDRAISAGVQMDEKGLPTLQQIEDFVRTHPHAAQPGPKTANPTAWIND